MMKIHKFSFMIIWIFATQNRLYRGENLYAPLIMVYDAKVRSYALTDGDILDLYGPQCERVILACSNPYSIPLKDVKSLDVMSSESVESRYAVKHVPLLCKKGFKPSMVANKPDQGGDFSVGFYFFDDTDNDQKLKEYDLPPFSSVMEKFSDIPRFSIYHLNTDFTTFSTNKTRHRIISYKPFISANKTPCEDFVNAVEEVLPSKIGKLYDKANQKKLWEKYDQPSCIKSFVRVQLTPIDDFTDSVSRRATCTHYNTVPIILKIYNRVIQKIENTIRLVADKMAVNTIEVTTKTYGVLELPLLGKKNAETGKLERGKVYLDPDNLLVPVPRIFLKIIHHRVPALRSNAGEHDDLQASSKYDHYYMIIGAYNSFGAKGDDVPSVHCNYEICEKYGWNIYIDPNYTHEKGYVFCCDIRDSVSMKNLELDFQGEPFDLNDFSRYQRRSD